VLLLVGTLAALATYTSSRIERVPVAGLGSARGMNILVVGSDSRDGLTDAEATELSTGRVAGKRADTIFVLSTRAGSSAILSFPRDLFVTRCDGSQGRINAAFAMAGGPGCLVETVAQTSGITITSYLEVNFLSFVNIVDAVGGVEVCSDEPIRDASAAIDLPAGCSRLDGATALGFVRVRKIDDDLGRIGRQQYFIQQLAREVASPSTVLNVPRLWSTAGAAGGALIADEEFGSLDLARLGLAARGMASGGTPTYVVPATPQTIGGAAVLVPAEAEAEALYASFRDGSVLTEQTEAEDESADR
jgi:LCP family protein required for cell wall assembly